MPTRQAIEDFLAGRRIAMIGVSRKTKSFPNSVFRELRNRDYELLPVNRHAEEIEGVECYRSVADLPDVDRAIIMVPPDEAAAVVTECADRGIGRVWLHKGGGPGCDTPEAVAVARERGLEIVDGACPLMFLENTGLIHRLHRRIAGRKILTA